ncbi:hypothetical protein SAMN06296273_1957 [Nitrosomonas ureae]|uniref:Uncharacterized protein n=2 Tax=Nitrosomonas ureae TaxID=44577 RepID=A0A285BZ44_9PROT|nr:hypothetical protein SAMN06296273_1957 [Nitrosomonas ureae]
MNKFALSIACALSLVVSGIQSAFAENVATVGDTVFILDNPASGSPQLIASILNADSTTSPNLCFSGQSSLDLGLGEGILATDITVNNGTAIITTTSTDVPGGVIFRDVSSCIAANSICMATVNGSLLTIPCVQYNNQVLTVVLEQRGNSMNWELTSSPILNDTFAGSKTNKGN